MGNRRGRRVQVRSGRRSEVTHYVSSGRDETLIPQHHVGLNMAREAKRLYLLFLFYYKNIFSGFQI